MNPNPPLPPDPGGMPGFGPYVHGTGPDQGLEEPRVRYARGELDRSDLLERSADLGGPPNPDATLPGQPTEPDQG